MTLKIVKNFIFSFKLIEIFSGVVRLFCLIKDCLQTNVANIQFDR